ncbi:hypothetical protein V6N13_136729 [Hibiscus sabdariffa]|uniref:SWIRM domain-containing protein n=1 Tax=Hibiscus sabdariffa TaxID=183260 RepID=A0ABR2DMQ5_9ROSI
METPVSEGLVSKRTLRKKSGQNNYDENLMDELIEKHIGGSFRKIRTKELEKETETEAMIALSLGFPIDALIEDEIKAGVVRELGGKEQNDYIVVRNHILSRWRSNVRIWLTKGQIKETVSNECEHLLSAAYDFLLHNGYINFGVSPLFSSYIPEEATEGSVIIVGAGLAGLAAARQLLSFGFKVVVIEGRNRPGGRVYTQQMGKKDKRAVVDLGGSVITGIHANPLGVLARQLSIPLHKMLDKVNELRKIMGGFANHISLGSVLEKIGQLYAMAQSPEERQLLEWHLANLEYANAGCLSDLSAAYWDPDDPYEMGGDHCFLAGGNWRLIKALSDGVPIIYGKPVDAIRYGVEGVEVVAGNQALQADMVLCTVPLGVLKRKTIRFEPELPQRKLAVIDRLGFGLLNKVAMIFPHVFWGEELDAFGCLNKTSDSRGEFFLFYSYHTVSGGLVLIALVAGEAAQTFECTDPSLFLHRVISKLRGIYGPKGVDVPDPIQTICTRWGNDPLSFGSYSHVRVQSSGRDYDILAESVGNRLFFAGEATTWQYPATMHGAYLSGLREASRILRATRGRQNYFRRSVQRIVGPSSDHLADLFKWPDLACGKFSFVFNPLTEDPKLLGLLRITFDNCKDDMRKVLEKSCDPLSNQPLQLYTMLYREQAHELQMVTGEEESKLVYLINDIGLKLMGANAVGITYNSLVTSISNARRGRGAGIEYLLRC